MNIILRHVKKIEYMLTNGCTDPLRAYLDDDTLVIIKVLNNIQGNLVLFNEYVCYEIALKIGLPVAPSGICIVDKNTTDELNTITADNFGHAFYSTYINSVLIKSGVINLLSNKDMFYRLILFDHIVYNSDRNICNLLTTHFKKDTSFKVIDHTHVFKNQTFWNAQCFKIGIAENDYMDTYIMESNQDLYNMFLHAFNFDNNALYKEARFIQPLITKELLDEIITKIPDDWAVPQNDLDALKEYILYRTSHIIDICDMIIKYVRRLP